MVLQENHFYANLKLATISLSWNLKISIRALKEKLSASVEERIELGGNMLELPTSLRHRDPLLPTTVIPIDSRKQ